MGRNSGIAIEESKSKESKVSHVVATRVVVEKPKGGARGELVEANQDDPEWSSEGEEESLGDTLQARFITFKLQATVLYFYPGSPLSV